LHDFRNSGLAAVAGAFGSFRSALVPGALIGLGYRNTFSDWLSLLSYPQESEKDSPLVFEELNTVPWNLRFLEDEVRQPRVRRSGEPPNANGLLTISV
jgi:hypothetical protein